MQFIYFFQLDLLVEKACDLIFAFVDGCPLSTRLHLLELLRSIIPALSSPLAAPRLVSSFVELSDAAFEACPVDDFFGKTNTNVSNVFGLGKTF